MGSVPAHWSSLLSFHLPPCSFCSRMLAFPRSWDEPRSLTLLSHRVNCSLCLRGCPCPQFPEPQVSVPRYTLSPHTVFVLLCSSCPHVCRLDCVLHESRPHVSHLSLYPWHLARGLAHTRCLVNVISVHPLTNSLLYLILSSLEQSSYLCTLLPS